MGGERALIQDFVTLSKISSGFKIIQKYIFSEI